MKSQSVTIKFDVEHSLTPEEFDQLVSDAVEASHRAMLQASDTLSGYVRTVTAK